MRTSINAVLAFIGQASLSDVEFDALEIESFALDAATHTAIAAVLESREAVSTALDQLRYYFLAKGVDVAATSVATTNIYLGSVLCE